MSYFLSLFSSLLPQKDSFRSYVLTLTTSNGLAQGLNAAGTIILARLFNPEVFGLAALFMTVNNLLCAVASWRYETAIVLPEKDEEAANVQGLSVLILGGMCFLSVLSVALFRHDIARLVGDDRLAPWLWGVPISLLLTGMYQALTFWCCRFRQFHFLGLSRVGLTLATIGCQLGGYLLGLGGAQALIFGWIAGQGVGALIILKKVFQEHGKQLWAPINFPSLRAQFLKYKNFPLFTAPYGFVGVGAKQLVFVILRRFADIHAVGLYSLASRAVYLPVSLVGTSLKQVFFEKAATEHKLGNLGLFVVGVLRSLIAFGTPVLIFLVFESKPLFRFILGDAWAQVGTYASLLAFIGFLEFVTSWLDRLFDVYGRQHVALIWEVLRDITGIGCLAWVLVVHHNPILGIATYVGVDFVWHLIWLIIVFRIAKFETANLWKLGGLFVSISCIAAASLWGLHALLRGFAAFVACAVVTLAAIGFMSIRHERRQEEEAALSAVGIAPEAERANWLPF